MSVKVQYAIVPARDRRLCHLRVLLPDTTELAVSRVLSMALVECIPLPPMWVSSAEQIVRVPLSIQE
jgi:hypothetical protein